MMNAGGPYTSGIVQQSLVLALFLVCSASGFGQTDWTLDVRMQSSVPFGRPAVGEGTGWGGQSLLVQEGAMTAGWGKRGTRSFGVSVRRAIGKSWQLAFGFEQTRRIWSAQVDWLDPAGGVTEPVVVAMEWIQASYSFPLVARTEVVLVPGWRLGAGGGLVWEILPTNAFQSGQEEGALGQYLSVEHETLRYGWNRWGMALELGVVKEGNDADLHIGGMVRPLLQPYSQGALAVQWNIGQPDVAVKELQRNLDGSWWGLDVRLILH